jgi:hypothetical protein
VLGQVGVDVLAQRVARVAEVIGRPEPSQRTERERQAGQVVQIDEPLIPAVPHVMAQRFNPDVRDVDGVEPRAHHEPPRLTAASMPDRQPSSWNPQPW